MVNEAIGEGDGSFANAASKAGRYNNFGELYDDEYQVALAMLQPAEFAPADVQVEPLDAKASALGIAEPVETVADQDAPIMTRDEANAELQRRIEALMAAKKTRKLAEDDLERARGAVTAAAMEWTRGGPSSDEIRRAEIAAINRDRGSKVEHGDRRPGPSRIDQEAFYGEQHNAGAYARKQMRYGSHHRAVFIDGEWRRPGRREVKLPSEV